MPHVKIKMVTTEAGPDGNYPAGTERLVDLATAHQLVNGGYATAIGWDIPSRSSGQATAPDQAQATRATVAPVDVQARRAARIKMLKDMGDSAPNIDADALDLPDGEWLALIGGGGPAAQTQAQSTAPADQAAKGKQPGKGGHGKQAGHKSGG